MISMMIWVAALAGSIAAVCLTVALNAEVAHLVSTALISFGIIAAGINDHRTHEMVGASPANLAAIATRYMGMLWAWSAISAYVVYTFLLEWPYCAPFVLSMFLACGLCLFLAWILDREAKSQLRATSGTFLVAMLAKSQFALGGLLLGIAIALSRQPDPTVGGTHRWVALNLVVCTAAALLTFTGYLLINRNVGLLNEAAAPETSVG